MDTRERDKQIATSQEHWSVLTERYGLSRASIYRIQREAREKRGVTAGARPYPEKFNVVAGNQQLKKTHSTRKAQFGQISQSGLTRHGGMIAEEFQRELQGDGGVAIYTEMATHPVVSAVLFAIEMSLRRVEWWFKPASEEEADKKAAVYVEECMGDMSQSQQEIFAQIFRPMLTYGFSLCELVYKKRLGQKPGSYITDPARSKHSDGKVGWRRWQFINPASLAAGGRWEFQEDTGRVQAVKQLPPPTYKPITIPMEKLLLFRTTVLWDNPEGKALALDTPVPTPSGWTTMGDIQVGDMVYDSEGRIRHVVAKSNIWNDRPVYRVTFKDGTKIIADENHLWQVTTSNDRVYHRQPRVITTKKMYQWENRTKKKQFFSAPKTPLLNAPNAALPIDPYIMSIEPAGTADTVCIEVDSHDHTYLVSRSMIPTHNSPLRSMYKPWYYAENLAEIEAIGGERLGLGLPVMYLGYDCSFEGGNSDYEMAQDVVVNVRADEQMGIVVPKPKMGTAGEGQGMLFELVSPPSRGFIDFDKVVTRYEQRMAMVLLAQFIFLGMTEIGTQALARTSVDFFSHAVGGWAEAVADVINRFAIPRLLALNGFSLEALPTLEHSELEVPDLKGLAEYVNKLIGAQVIAPYPELGRHLLEMAKLPLPEDEGVLKSIGPQSGGEGEEGGEGGAGGAGGGTIQLEMPEEEGGEEGGAEGSTEAASDLFPSHGLEQFAKWGAKAGQVITGALGRDSRGQFTRLGEGETSPDSLMRAIQSGSLTPLQAEALAVMGLIEPGSGNVARLTPEGAKIISALKNRPELGRRQLQALMTRMKRGKGSASVRKKKEPTKKSAKKPKRAAKKKGRAKKGRGGGRGGGGGEEPEVPLEERMQAVMEAILEHGLTGDDMEALMALVADPDAAEDFDFQFLGRLVAMGLLTREEVSPGEYVYDVAALGTELVNAVMTGDVEGIEGILAEIEVPEPEEEEAEESSSLMDAVEQFALRLKRGGPKYERATNAYQLRLQSAWRAWAERTAQEMARAEDEAERERVLEAAVAAIVTRMIAMGRESLPQALALGLGQVHASPQAVRELSEALAENERYLTQSLQPGVIEKVRERIARDPSIVLETAAIAALLMTFLGRVGQYAGAYWNIIWWGVIERARQLPNAQEIAVRWVLDPEVSKHCATCLEYAGEYENYEAMLSRTGGIVPGVGTICNGNCRCSLQFQAPGKGWLRW